MENGLFRHVTLFGSSTNYKLAAIFFAASYVEDVLPPSPVDPLT